MLEYEWLLLAKSFNWTHSEIMAMPVSRRHKAVKFQEELSRQREKRQQTNSVGPVVPSRSWYQTYQKLSGNSGNV